MLDHTLVHAAGLNNWLYNEAAVYPQATFHLVESVAAPGHSFLHDENPLYTAGDIARTIRDVRDFVGKWGSLDSTCAIMRRVAESGGELEPDFGGAVRGPVAEKSGSSTVPGGVP
jgi:hypothetical protein